MFDIFKLFSSSTTFGRNSVSAETIQKIKLDWGNISILLKGKSPSQLRQALITADKTLDAALKDIVAGETMGDRLKNAKDKFDRNIYNKIWNAHKIRNALVHEAGYEPGYSMLTKAIEDIRVALSKIGVIV